jgi:hypothetical protein
MKTCATTGLAVPVPQYYIIYILHRLQWYIEGPCAINHVKVDEVVHYGACYLMTGRYKKH